MDPNNLELYSHKSKLDNKTLDMFSNRMHTLLYCTVNDF